MGKKAFKDRRRLPCVHPLNNRDEDKFPQAKDGDFGDVDHSTLNWGFLSYPEALEKCESDGWKEAQFYPEFTSEALCQTINSKLTGITVIDESKMIPDGYEGNYSMFPLAGYLLNKKSFKDESVAYLVMRTEKNTPAFLSGMLAGHMAERGGDFACAREYVNSLMTTPAGLVIHAGKQMVFPTVVTQGSTEIASNMVVSMLEDAPHKFACAICNESFMTFCGSSWGTEPFIAFQCDHAFHPWCASEHWKAGGRSCPTCNATLNVSDSPDPVAWYDAPLSVEEAMALDPKVEDFEIVLNH